MFEVKPTEIIVMLLFGTVAGMLASMAVMIWGAALWMVVGEGRSFRGPDLNPRPTPLRAMKRLIVAMPLIALLHPFPWLLALVVWFGFSLLRGSVEPQWIWFSLPFFGWFVWSAWYFLRLRQRSAL